MSRRRQPRKRRRNFFPSSGWSSPTGRTVFDRTALLWPPLRTETGRLLQKAIDNGARMVDQVTAMVDQVTAMIDCDFAELERRVAAACGTDSFDVHAMAARICNRTHYLCAKCEKERPVYFATGNEAEHWCLCEGCAPDVDSEYLARCYARRET